VSIENHSNRRMCLLLVGKPTCYDGVATMASKKRVLRPPTFHVGVTTLTRLQESQFNIRTHDKAEIEQAIEHYHAVKLPFHVIIDENGLVLSGYAAVIASERLGLNQLTTTRREPPLTTRQKQTYLIEDGHQQVAMLIGPPSRSKN
jgi:hypothetical protein